MTAPPAAPAEPAQPMRSWHTEFARLRVGDLIPAHEYARSVRGGWVDTLHDEWDDLRMGAMTVSRRADGKHYLIAGRHRSLALHDADRDDEVVDCHVYVGLTLKQEAILFHALDMERLRHSAGDQVPALRLMDDPRTLAIDRILAGIGPPDDPLRLDLLGRKGSHSAKAIGAVSALQTCYDMAGPLVLERGLRIIYDSWIDPPAPLTTPPVKAYSAEAIRAVVGVVARYCRPDVNPRLDEAELVEALRIVTPAGFKANLLRKKASLMDNQAGQGERTLLLTLVDIYNAYLRSKRRGRDQIDVGLIMLRVPWWHTGQTDAGERARPASSKAYNRTKRRNRAEERARREAQDRVRREKTPPSGATGEGFEPDSDARAARPTD